MSNTRCRSFALVPALVILHTLVAQENARGQCQVDKVTTSAGSSHAGDRYGWSVAVSGNYAVVGSDVGDGGGSHPQADTGAAFLLQRNGLNWVEIQELVANDSLASAFGHFGASVAISEHAKFIVVGAPQASGNLGVAGAGAVYVFKRYQDLYPCTDNTDCAGAGLATCTSDLCEGRTWAIEAILRADDPTTGDGFGFSVDISGKVIVVGADRTDDVFDPLTGTGDSGAAYVFRRYEYSFPCASTADCQAVGLRFCVGGKGVCQGITWVQEQKLMASDAAAQELFGSSVSIVGHRILVGAKSIFGPGGAFIFEYNGSTWDEIQKLTSSDGEASDSFGQSVDQHGDFMVVTAMSADSNGVSNAGKAYVYRRIGGTFGDERILTASNAASSDRFGRSASLHGNMLLIGAQDTDVPGSRAGSAYLFSFDGANWNEIELILPDDAAGDDRFGHAVSLSETHGIVGAYREDDAGLDAGAAYVFAIGLGRDCNANLVHDDCDVLFKTEPDANGNGTPDGCECEDDGDCPSGDACSVVICNQDKLCELSVKGGYCRVDNVCYWHGTANPNNSCQACNASVDQEGFTSFVGSTPCDDDHNECTLDVCVFGSCNQPQPGSACGDPTDTECSRPNICNGEGNCDPNDRLPGTACTGDGNPCTDNTCDGAGNCDAMDLPKGTACAVDGNLCKDDVCDGAGNCEIVEGGTNGCPGMVKSHQKISDTQGGFTNELAIGHYFGASVTSLGDLDGDGVADLAVGAYGDDDGGSDRGAVWIVFLNTDGTVKSHQKISALEGGFTGRLGSDQFGVSVAYLGDMDGDGVGDLAVGANDDVDGGLVSGAVWVLFLTDDGTVKSHQKISSTEGGFIGMLDSRDDFGGSMTSLGDLDGDGVGDLAVGAYRDDDGGNTRGAVWVLFLHNDGTVKSHQKISDAEGGFVGALDDVDAFGISVASLGDLDGDGVGDLAVGATGDDDGGVARGAVWVLFLNTDGTVKSHQKISATQGGFAGSLDSSDGFGSSLASMGDLDGDGVGDLAVGAIGDDDGGDRQGAVWVLFLGTDGMVKSHQKISAAQGAFAGSLDDDDRFGSSLASLGDLNGDGPRDMAVGARLDGDGGLYSGALWVLFLDGAPGACFGKTVGTPCTDDGDPCTDNVCDGVGSCGVNNLPEGTFCYDGNPCTRNMCDGAGGCIVNDLPIGSLCPDDGNPCTGDGCDGVGNCGVILPEGTACPEDGDPCTDDLCDGAGTCEHNDDGTRLCVGTVQWHQKISDTEGGFTGSLDSSGVFGASLVLLGDLDGDGVGDLAVGAPGIGDGLLRFGVVWILFLNADGTVKSHQEIGDDLGGFTGTLSNYGKFGSSMTALGDLDGDGVADLAVGERLSRDGGSSRGAVWVIFLNSDGTVKAQQLISDTQGGFTGKLYDRDEFGSSVASLGDLDGDGVGDLAVGAVGDDDGGSSRGAVWILFLNTDGTVKTHEKISDAQEGFAGLLADGDHFGSSVALLGDLDGDGVPELAAGAYLDGPGTRRYGAVWVLFLNRHGMVKSHQKIGISEGSFSGPLGPLDFFGSSVTSLGDLDGDGVDDLAVGAVRDDDGGSWSGAVWVLFLNNDGTVKSHQKISATQGGLTGTLGPYYNFGSSVTSLGDLDGDGVGDLAVGVPGDDDGGSHGAVWVLFLDGPPGECFGAVAGTPCQDDGNDCTDNVCDAAGNCGVNLPEWAVCPDDGDPCTDNVCDGAGTCGVNNLPKGTTCDDGNPCTYDMCDGAGGCDVNDLPKGTACTDDGFGCTDDVCDGAGACEHLNDDMEVCAGAVKSHQKISDTEGGFTGTLDDDGLFGDSITSLGDLNGDGAGDLAVGADGAVWVLFVNAEGTVTSQQKISSNQGGFAGGFSTGRASVASLGDGDGVGDLAAGAVGDDDGGSNRGAVWVLFLNNDGTVKSHQEISAAQGGFTGTVDNTDIFGSSVASVGDLDGDGIGELVVGASGDDDGEGGSLGAVWVLFLEGEPFVPPCDEIQASWPPNCTIDARQPSTIDGLTVQGWEAIDVTVGPVGCTLVSGDLSVESKPTGPAPTINKVSQVGDVATITFDSIITRRNWTCVSLTTDATQQACLGNLPADVNGDGTSNPALDITALIDCIQSPGTCMDWQVNIDRTGTGASMSDLTRLIDLFNGAGAYDSWTGASFSGVTCPSNQ